MAMRYVKLDNSGNIDPIGDFANLQPGVAENPIDENDPRFVAYRAAILPASLPRSKIMRQLNAEGKLSAAQTAIVGADPLTQELWKENTWFLADLQQAPFAAMIGGLGIDLPTFWAAASRAAL